MVFFISDTHFYHSNIVNLNSFRFEGFENVILSYLESILTEKDTVFHLGDFTWHLKDFNGYLKRWMALPAKKVLIKGNHDIFKNDELSLYFDEIYDFYKILELEGKRFFLSHYPVIDLRKKERYIDRMKRVYGLFRFYNCDFLIHGHVHRNTFGIHCGCFLKGVKCKNVNVEFTGFRPVSLYDMLKEVE